MSRPTYVICGMWQISWAFLFVTYLGVNGEESRKRVCIVGAGMSGLVSLKYLRDYPNEFETIVFEKNSDVGGLWIYTNSTTVDEHGLPITSAIYKNLRTNAPKQIMTFADYPNFEGEGEDGSFVKHEDVLEYLRNYTAHFSLRQSIQFDTYVEKITPLPGLKWLITTQNLNTRVKSQSTCDAVIVCNGHDVARNIPKIPGIDSFTGQVLHSQEYRVAEKFTNQTVVLLGAGTSGIDIGIEISSRAQTVYLSHRHDKISAALPPSMIQVPGVVAADGDELILSDNSRIRADSLMFCTGYIYEFPFLDESSGIVVDGDGKYVRPLHKHLVNIQRPTMAIMKIINPGLNIFTLHAQISYFGAVLRGKLNLPSREKMLLEAKLPEGVPKKKAHIMSYEVFFDYYDELALAGGGRPRPCWIAPAVEIATGPLVNDPLHYKDNRLYTYEDCHVEFFQGMKSFATRDVLLKVLLFLSLCALNL